MTGWHLDDDTLRRYVERTDSLAEGASAEQHLLSCEPCRARVTAAASVTELSVIDFAAVWDRTRDAIEVPRPSVFERLLRGAGLPAHEARLVAVASAFRGVWLTGVVAVLAFAALAAAIGHAGGEWLFLAVAPAWSQDKDSPDAALEQLLKEARENCTQPADRLSKVLCGGRIRIGVRDYYPLFSTREGDERSGYEVDVAQAIAKRLDLPMEKVIVTINTQGNTSAASVPLALDTGIRDGRVQRGQMLLLEAFGGGFTWGSALIRY